jgi:putative tryptophan/tyrosine transport system substrate-binding protein
MRRRDFIAGVASAAALPLAARAQERVRRVGLLMNLAEDGAEAQARVAAFVQALQERGWTVGRNVQIDTRWGEGDPDRYRQYASELINREPDVVLTSGGSAVSALQRATRTVPIVFVTVTDPVGGGLVASLSQPGGNTTGFTQFEFGMSAKWLELLKEIAPDVTRAGVLRAAAFPTGIGQFAAIQPVAPALRVELKAIDVRDAGEIEQAVTTFAREPKGGLIVTSNPLMTLRRELIIELAAKHRLPTIYSSRHFATGGGLVSYGPDALDQFRRAAGYVDRILKGERPADLPVQVPTKYELVINLKTAKALGLEVPATLLAHADEVIE